MKGSTKLGERIETAVAGPEADVEPNHSGSLAGRSPEPPGATDTTSPEVH
jgi:hypothetical protein